MRKQFAQLKANSLTIAVLCVAIFVAAASAATASKLISGKQIKDRSISAKDIKNYTLTKKQLSKKLSLQGATGPAGPAGPATAEKVAVRSYPLGLATSSANFVSIQDMAFTFDMPQNASQVQFDFNMMCGANGGAQVEAEIFVDGVAVPPSDGIICAAPSFVGASLLRVASVAPGPHDIDVKYRARFGIGAASIQNPILVVRAF